MGTSEHDALKYLVEEAGPKNILEAVREIDLCGAKYVARMGSGTYGLPPAEPCAAILFTVSLESFAAYVARCGELGDADDPRPWLIDIEPRGVALHSPLRGRHRVRETLLEARVVEDEFPWGRELALVEMIIALQARFGQTDERDRLLQLLASVKKAESVEVVDDGVSQEVNTARSLGLQERTRINKPFVLQPHRTFPEVGQPESPFVLRLHDGFKASLHETDAGRWETAARTRIKDWLAQRMEAYGAAGDRFLFLA